MGTTTEPVRIALRKLWSDHVIWTRQYIIAAVAGTPDADAAAARLLRNQEDIGDAIVPFYGEAAGSRLTERQGWALRPILHYLEEEAGHEQWILNDIAQAGGDRDQEHLLVVGKSPQGA